MITHSVEEKHQPICDNLCGDKDYNFLSPAYDSYNIMDTTTAEHIRIQGVNYSCREINCLYFKLISGCLTLEWLLLNLGKA